jgi:hypothetical protein
LNRLFVKQRCRTQKALAFFDDRFHSLPSFL